MRAAKTLGDAMTEYAATTAPTKIWHRNDTDPDQRGGAQHQQVGGLRHLPSASLAAEPSVSSRTHPVKRGIARPVDVNSPCGFVLNITSWILAALPGKSPSDCSIAYGQKSLV